MVQSVSCLADHSSQRFSGSRDGSFAPVSPRESERFSPLCPAVRTSPIRDATIRAAATRYTQLLDQFFVSPRPHSTWKPAPAPSGRRPLADFFGIIIQKADKMHVALRAELVRNIYSRASC